MEVENSTAFKSFSEPTAGMSDFSGHTSLPGQFAPLTPPCGSREGSPMNKFEHGGFHPSSSAIQDEVSCGSSGRLLVANWHQQIISGPLQYLLASNGKGFRGKLMGAFNQFLQVPNDKLEVINRVVELLHTASLL